MGTHLIDSNTAIEFLGEVLPASGSRWLDNLVAKNLHHLSIINRIELLGYNGKPSEMQAMADFVQASSVLLLAENVVLKTIEIRKQIKIKLPDAIIAATALTHNLTLVSRNTNDFKNIPGLKVINPHLV
ncbi:MAG: type II toxin-antitoxin system VapC family toxin [Lewinellaceae bacterium]|nr:type II toxin-antitoxin system VapC family toxin [Saprospiraceae bacterium]MCB9339120.1 type II toxin-antitoxin system VapC family toxin [Lewinellaceae bacterium]